MRIDRIDHFVLTVTSIETTLDFYTRVLGLEVESFGPGSVRKALCFGNQKIKIFTRGSRRTSISKRGTRPLAAAISA